MKKPAGESNYLYLGFRLQALIFYFVFQKLSYFFPLYASGVIPDRCLKKLEDNTYDLTLLFGPMYHLMTKAEKIQALSEAKRVTKPGGIILVAYVMNEYAVVVYGIQENHIEESVKNGTLDASYHTVPAADSLYAFERIEDIDGYNEAVGLKREKILSPDGPANYIRPFVNQLSEESYELFVAYQLKVCERPDLIGAGAHTVDILRK